MGICQKQCVPPAEPTTDLVELEARVEEIFRTVDDGMLNRVLHDLKNRLELCVKIGGALAGHAYRDGEEIL